MKAGKKMKHGLWALLLMAACSGETATTHEHPIRTSYEEGGGEIGWYGSDTQFIRHQSGSSMVKVPRLSEFHRPIRAHIRG